MARRPANLDAFGPMLTLADVAAVLGVHVDTARRYVKSGGLPAHRLPNSKQFYILKDELLAFIRSQPKDPALSDDTRASARDAAN